MCVCAIFLWPFKNRTLLLTIDSTKISLVRYMKSSINWNSNRDDLFQNVYYPITVSIILFSIIFAIVTRACHSNEYLWLLFRMHTHAHIIFYIHFAVDFCVNEPSNKSITIILIDVNTCYTNVLSRTHTSIDLRPFHLNEMKWNRSFQPQKRKPHQQTYEFFFRWTVKQQQVI